MDMNGDVEVVEVCPDRTVRCIAEAACEVFGYVVGTFALHTAGGRVLDLAQRLADVELEGGSEVHIVISEAACAKAQLAQLGITRNFTQQIRIQLQDLRTARRSEALRTLDLLFTHLDVRNSYPSTWTYEQHFDAFFELKCVISSRVLESSCSTVLIEGARKQIEEGLSTVAVFTPMFLNAARGGRVAQLRILLAAGAEVDGVNRRGETGLASAVAGGSLQTCALLLAHGADPRHIASRGRTVTNVACTQLRRHYSTHGWPLLDCLKLLYSKGAHDVDTPDDAGNTALDCVLLDSLCAPSALLGVRTLLELGARVSERTLLLTTRIMLPGVVQLVKQAVLEQRADEAAGLVEGALRAAVCSTVPTPRDYAHCLQELVRDEPALRGDLLSTLLKDAAQHRLTHWPHLAHIFALPTRDDLPAVLSPAMSAAVTRTDSQSGAHVRLLLSWGADPDLRDSSGRTPLDQALEHNKKDVVVALLGAGVDVSAQDSEGRTALHVGAMRASDKTLDVLLCGLKAAQLQAVLDACDGQGQTALMCAVRAKKRKNVACLLQHGADMSKPDAAGVLPVDAAACVPAMAALLHTTS